MRVFTSLDEVRAAAGAAIGTTGWIEIDQARIDAFAAATDDHQWIHVDPERSATGPYGATIAHGYLTLSLLPRCSAETFRLAFPGARLNYGLNKVRFPAPVRAGSRIRGHVSFSDVADVPAGTQLVQRYVIEIEGEQKPACVAETVVLLLG